MTEKELIKQLKCLKALGANSDWKKTNRAVLISQIKGQATAKPQNFPKKFWYGLRSIMPLSIKNFVYKPVGAIVLTLAVISTVSILGVNASKGSVPGDVLYKVKLTKEKIQAGLTVDDEKKTNLYLNFANERLKEIEKLQKEQNEQNENEKEEQNENIKIAVQELKDQVSSVKNQMEKIKEKPQPAQEMVEAVKNVDKKVEELSDKIKEKSSELEAQDPENEVVLELDDAREIIDETSDSAMEVIIEKHFTGEVETSMKELAQKVENKINKAEEEINEIQLDVEQINVEKKKEAAKEFAKNEDSESSAEENQTESVQEQSDEKSEPADSEEPEEDTAPAVEKESVERNSASGDSSADATLETENETEKEEKKSEFVDWEEISEKPDQARGLVDEARELLKQGDISNAFRKIVESKVLTREIQQKIEAFEKTQKETTDTKENMENIEDQTEQTEIENNDSAQSEEKVETADEPASTDSVEENIKTE